MKHIAIAVILIGSAFSQTTRSLQERASTKQSTIFIGMELQLGMARDSIIPRLAARYQVVKIQDTGDDWMVEEKDDTLTTLGSLGFTSGKLTYAAKDWTQGHEDNFEFAQALRAALVQMEFEGHSTCSIESPSSRSPAAETAYLRFYCGVKRVDVVTTHVLNGRGKGRYVSITEVLSSEKNR